MRVESDFLYPISAVAGDRGADNSFRPFFTDLFNREGEHQPRHRRGREQGERDAIRAMGRDALRERGHPDRLSLYRTAGGGGDRIILLRRPMVRPGPWEIRPGRYGPYWMSRRLRPLRVRG
jgi:hypothetical protein